MMGGHMRSGIYSGTVFHRRLRPRPHALKYRLFMLLVDLDEWTILVKRLGWLKPGRFSLMSLRSRDYGDRSATPLKVQVECRLIEAGLPTGGSVQLLTMPRILGYAFNPISIYFCHDKAGQLTATLYEVSNTFGGRHSYLIPVDSSARPIRQTARQTVEKAFHVSPFMDMDLTYHFEVDAPAGIPEEKARISVAVHDCQGPLMLAGFTGQRSEISDRELRRAWLSHPLLTLKVIFAIHWEALKLLLKGLRLRPGITPDYPVTLGHPSPLGASHE